MANKSVKSSPLSCVEEFHKAVAQKGRVKAVADKMVELPANVNPPLFGSQMRIWKQDPSVKELNLPRTVYIHTQVNEGPSDSQITIQGVHPVTPDANAMIEIAEADGEKNCVHFIRKHFEFGQVLGANAIAGPVDLSQFGLYADRRCCCGTMQHPQYMPHVSRSNGKRP